MKESLIFLLEKYGIMNYTCIIMILGVVISTIYNIILSLTNYIDNRARFYFAKRKELKKNMRKY